MSVGLGRAGGALGIAVAAFISLIAIGRTVDTSSGRDVLTAGGVVGGVATLFSLYALTTGTRTSST